MNAKRKAIEEIVYKTFSALDKTGSNTVHYKTLFSKMNDAEFDKFMKNFLNDEDQNFYLEIEPYVKEPSMDDIEEAAKILGVPLYEKVTMPFINPNGEPIVTSYEVPVGYVPLKRVQQILTKKNTMSTNISKRNPKTGGIRPLYQ